jgi:hypothetical protein
MEKIHSTFKTLMVDINRSDAKINLYYVEITPCQYNKYNYDVIKYAYIGKSVSGKLSELKTNNLKCYYNIIFNNDWNINMLSSRLYSNDNDDDDYDINKLSYNLIDTTTIGDFLKQIELDYNIFIDSKEYIDISVDDMFKLNSSLMNLLFKCNKDNVESHYLFLHQLDKLFKLNCINTYYLSDEYNLRNNIILFYE